MRFERLSVDGLRCLRNVSIQPGPGLNVFVGANGAGKTSLLEAMYLLSYGRSFRSGSRDVLRQRGADELRVYGEICHADDHLSRLGLGRGEGGWRIRVDGVTGERISDLIRHCAVVCFEPGSHALVSGAADTRRRFLDWGVFHVEHCFLDAWRRYRRALRQRNALLRTSTSDPASFMSWEREMGVAARAVHDHRQAYLTRLEPQLQTLCERMIPELGALSLRYRAGWDTTTNLADTLAEQRDRDRMRGYTTLGIHRADWRTMFSEAPQREYLSRGQEKLVALACLMAQAHLYADFAGQWPVICLDDLASELDAAHQQLVLRELVSASAQVMITGTAIALPTQEVDTRMFHVEHGQVLSAKSG
ncbi:MAG TPA: DNA replication/repair protein RecF [Oleiagrimonas sp.]|nr:DNA replication/repair protein RecF [Oleiagrimonas sp.]